jgi:hypothetical protein
MPGGVGGAVSDGRPYPDMLIVFIQSIAFFLNFESFLCDTLRIFDSFRDLSLHNVLAYLVFHQDKLTLFLS